MNEQPHIRFKDSPEVMPVGKIICLGRNYSEHAREMKAVLPKEPVLFLKPPTAIVHDGGSVVFPPFSTSLHHEVEMVIAIKTAGRNIEGPMAADHIAGYGVGLDMTLRDVQSRAKKEGLPWSVAKGFDTSAPVSDFIQRDLVADPSDLDLHLKVNGELRQDSNTRYMLFNIDQMIAYISRVFTLLPGDLIFTGTPEGVGPVEPGDHLEADLGSVASLHVTIEGGLSS